MFQENLKNKNLGDLNRIYKKCLKEENILKYNDFNQKSLFFKEDNLKNFFEEIFNSLHSSNLTRKINIEYLGFTDGIETDFMLKHLSIKPFDGNKIEDTFFTQKITNIQDLNNFIFSNCENIIDDLTFFQPISRINLDDFNINFNSILNLNDSNFNNIKIEFLTNFKEMSFGFYKKEFPPVGYEYSFKFCNKEIVFYNLKLIYNYIFLIYEQIIKTNSDYYKLLCTIPNLQKYFPIILNNIDALTPYFAYNKEFFINLNKNNTTSFKLEEIILKSLKYNSEIYKMLDNDLRQNKDICKELINLNINNILLISKYGIVDNNELKDYLLKYFDKKFKTSKL